MRTERLIVTQLEAQPQNTEALLNAIPTILSEAVVAQLPPYFHNIQNPDQAQKWLNTMLAQAKLYLVHLHDQSLIGFIFVYENDEEQSAHLGYLLAQTAWGNGYAKEMLTAFIAHGQLQSWHRLIAGVTSENQASIKVLQHLGFTLAPQDSNAPSDSLFFVKPLK